MLWGSGVGYDPADDDRLYPQKQNNLTNIPMKAFVGGVEAAIAYRGRSQFPGVDQVVLTIPASVPTGCYVSLSIVSDTIVSNSVTIPIAASGKTCSDPKHRSHARHVPEPRRQDHHPRRNPDRQLSPPPSPAAGTRTDGTVGGIFQSVSGFATSSGGSQVSLGQLPGHPTYGSFGLHSRAATGLDAGASIAVTGPGGNPHSLANYRSRGCPWRASTRRRTDSFRPVSFLPPAEPSYFDNGAGGKDVQHFNATLNLPAAFTWTNAAADHARSTARRVSTSPGPGGAAGSYVSITGSSHATIGGKLITVQLTSALRRSPPDSLRFLPSVLLSLPAGNGSHVGGGLHQRSALQRRRVSISAC